MGTYLVKWKVKQADFQLSVDSQNPDVMMLQRGNALPHFFTRAEAYVFAKQITKNFGEVGRRSLLEAEKNSTHGEG